MPLSAGQASSDDGSVPGPPHVAETHISWVLLTGDMAYKVMKPLRTDVLDQGDVETRRAACAREVALNARLAPDVYQGVGSIVLDGVELEPVIVMRRMPDERRLTALLDTPGARDAVRDVARRMAAFHASAPVADEVAADALAGAEALRRRWHDDLAGLREASDDERVHAVADELAELSSSYLAGRAPLLAERIAAGMIRDGHGDLLAEDVFCLDDGPRILDCLAFDDALRTVDVLADVAFLVMDLQRLGHHGLAEAFLRDYVGFTDEHHPSSLAHLYVAQRALVRAKVTAMRQRQDPSAAGDALALLELSLDHLRRCELRLVLVGGIPGSGKTTLARTIGDEFGFVVLASDEVRRDLGLRGADIGERAYDAANVDRVYVELVERAEALLARGCSVVLDATWTSAASRSRARAAAVRSHARVVEVRCDAPPALCRRRIGMRAPEDAGASEAIPSTVDVIAGRTDAWPEALTVDTSGRAGETMLSLQRTWWLTRRQDPPA